MAFETQSDGRAARPTLLFILGMGRSGTSALTRVLSLCGAALPAALVGATDANPLGHWEPQSALEVNETFLSEHGSTWFDPTLRLQEEIAFSAEQRAAFGARIETFLRSLPNAPLLVIKEPRITALSTFWFEAARRTGFSLTIVIPVRHPQEVAASLAVRDRASKELSSALWLKYNLLAERHSRDLRRVFVEYTSLLNDWRTQLSRIGAALSVNLSARDGSSVDEFLRQDLRRQHHSGQIPELSPDQWVSRVYSALCAAARDEVLDTSSLDEVYGAYRACEHGVRGALDDFRSRFTSTQIGRKPNVTKLIHAIACGDSQTLKACLHSPWYRQHNADVFAARCDPYTHWLAYGVAEGRLPSADPLALLDNLLQERMGPPSTS